MGRIETVRSADMPLRYRHANSPSMELKSSRSRSERNTPLTSGYRAVASNRRRCSVGPFVEGNYRYPARNINSRLFAPESRSRSARFHCLGGDRQGEVESRTVSGATSITVHCKFTDKEGKVLLERDIDGKVRFFGDNLKATDDFAKKTAKLASEHFTPDRNDSDNASAILR